MVFEEGQIAVVNATYSIKKKRDICLGGRTV